MPLYHYKALNSRGEMLDGQMEAASNAEVIARLQEQGHLPVEASSPAKRAARRSGRALFKPKPFAGARLVQFTQQLATLLGAGQPLDRALGILLELPEDEVARNARSPTCAMRCAAAARCRRRWNASTARSRVCTSTWCAPVKPAAACTRR